MKLIRHLEELPTELRGGAVSIGNFDGVHLGHARIVETLRAQAATVGGPAIVFTFDPHPVRLLRPDAVPPPLTWADRKAELIEELGIDGMVVYPTDENLLALTPNDFFRQIVVERLDARAMVEGPNFFFGKDRAGNIEVLRALCGANGVSLEVVPPLTLGGDYVSSSRIRGLIEAGNVAQAAEMLTRPYRIRGMVTHGAGRGAKLGFPTANIDAIDTILPGIGVYAGSAFFGSQRWPTAVNIGPNPTFGEDRLKVEAHLIGYSGSLYGQPLEVDFLTRVRETRPFASVDELTAQLKRDVEFATEVIKHQTSNIEHRTQVPAPRYPLMTVNWSRFSEIIQAHERFLLTSHIRPDCDALGSELGMALILEALGKRVTIVNGMETPPNLAFIDPENRIKVIGQDIQLAELDDIEVLMVLDTSAWAQLGPMGDVLRATKAKKIVLDHHLSEDDLDAESFKNTTAEAAGRLVVEAAEALDVALTPEMAMPIFAALATDTGWFRFGSVTSGTYRIAAKLLEAGASPPAIYRDLYEQDTLGRVKLRGIILSRTETELDGRLAHTYVLKEDFVRAGALPADTEDAINMTLAIAGVQFAVILVEQDTGGFKLSFRSRCDVQCNKIAEQFNGGGHKAAAGAFIEGSFAEAQPTVLDAVRAAMQ